MNASTQNKAELSRLINESKVTEMIVLKTWAGTFLGTFSDACSAKDFAKRLCSDKGVEYYENDFLMYCTEV